MTSQLLSRGFGVTVSILVTYLPILVVFGLLCLNVAVVFSTLNFMRKSTTSVRESAYCLVKYCMATAMKFGTLLFYSKFNHGIISVTNFQQTLCLIFEFCAAYNLVIFLSRLFYIEKKVFRGIQISIYFVALMFFIFLPFALQVELKNIQIVGLDILFLGNSMPVEVSLLNECQTSAYLLIITIAVFTIFYGLKNRFKVSSSGFFQVYIKGIILLFTISSIKLFALPPRREMFAFFFVRIILLGIYSFASVNFLLSINKLMKTGTYRITHGGDK